MEKISFEIINNSKAYTLNFIGLGSKKELDEEKVFKAFSYFAYSRVKSKIKIKDETIYLKLCNKNLVPLEIKRYLMVFILLISTRARKTTSQFSK